MLQSFNALRDATPEGRAANAARAAIIEADAQGVAASYGWYDAQAAGVTARIMAEVAAKRTPDLTADIALGGVAITIRPVADQPGRPF